MLTKEPSRYQIHLSSNKFFLQRTNDGQLHISRSFSNTREPAVHVYMKSTNERLEDCNTPMSRK
jgi:hypothetical protein